MDYQVIRNAIQRDTSAQLEHIRILCTTIAAHNLKGVADDIIQYATKLDDERKRLKEENEVLSTATKFDNKQLAKRIKAQVKRIKELSTKLHAYELEEAQNNDPLASY
jgi:cephalosporin-C deacetylase-like acetyl esterase